MFYTDKKNNQFLIRVLNDRVKVATPTAKTNVQKDCTEVNITQQETEQNRTHIFIALFLV